MVLVVEVLVYAAGNFPHFLLLASLRRTLFFFLFAIMKCAANSFLICSHFTIICLFFVLPSLFIRGFSENSANANKMSYFRVKLKCRYEKCEMSA